ncbi:putative cop9 signalosome complex subunit 12 protein [Botrytis fragariae]|uniref:Protein CSN12 homolog n=1 Tax=Botrytis fragariae TaxID=1964551 RepID=A0A8H6EE63_9HELO|nr:putative cop9 signalosome complex subunit 12 protein [Botrytis fragariae]KAF5868997.1 putative cop9 signalosome complex subunit 12 protein [Botrytis fragariae]
MDAFLHEFKAAYNEGNGYSVSMTLYPVAPASNPNRLREFYRSTNFEHVKKDIEYRLLYDDRSPLNCSVEEGRAWVDVYCAFWKFIGFMSNAEAAPEDNSKDAWTKVYESWKEVTNALHRGYSACGFEAWTVPCLYVAGKYLRIFAIKADEASGTVSNAAMNYQDDLNPESETNEKLEDAARQLNRIFTLCLSDRASLEESRKWATYNIINLLFKTYFKLNSIGLSRNILNAIQAYRGDMPSLESFPMSHQAEKYLTEAWTLCHKSAVKNKELILTYLIPCHLLTTHTLPTPALLQPYPKLQKLFGPLSRCIKKGDLAGFDAALLAGENEFVKRRIYLTLERGRDIALRNLLRKVFIAGGYEEAKEPTAAPVRRTRIPVAEFAAAISIGSKETMENDEVECLLANMIYKSLMKGYISRAHGIVVLSKGGAFPGTGV